MQLIMLQISNKPEVLRLHNLQINQRTKFCSSWGMILNEILSPNLLRIIKSSTFLSQVATSIPDIYYTFITICYCKRRLGEEYTYVAMYKQKDYEQQGVLLNKKIRVLLFILEIISRNIFVPFLTIISKVNEGQTYYKALWGRTTEFIKKYFGSAEDIITNTEWLTLMLFMLNWNKHFDIIQTILGIRYVYTYKNDKLKDISYRIEGFLILATLFVKFIKHICNLYQQNKDKHISNVSQNNSKQNVQNELSVKKKETVLCRICYDDLKYRSATRCGHTFCWQCIIKTLQITGECPVCRANSLPSEVVQIRNY